jgi:hypothetical protein
MVEKAPVLASQTMQADNFDDFKKSLIALNQTVRDYETDTTNVFRDKGELVNHNNQILWIAPPPEEVDGLLQEAWNQSLDITPPHKRAEYLIYAINAIHPFKNGNGRAGRALYCALTSSDESFKDQVWAQTPSPIFSAEHNALIEKSLIHDLRKASGQEGATSLILKDCQFDDPYYWMYKPWVRGMTNEYKTLLQEKKRGLF